jgi:hypothetical protein
LLFIQKQVKPQVLRLKIREKLIMKDEKEEEKERKEGSG